MTETEKNLPTLVRIKRKRKDEPLDALLVADGKKVKFSSARVFKFIESVQHPTDFSPSALEKAKTHSYSMKRNRSVELRKEVLAHKKLNQAKQARYKLVSSNRTQIDGIQLLDVSRVLNENDGAEDIVTKELMPMVEEYLKISSYCKSIPIHSEEAEEYVFDLYYYEPSTSVKNALETENNNVGTLEWQQDDNIFLNDYDETDSNLDSEDSNAEDYYSTCKIILANDYPDEENYVAISDSDDPLASENESSEDDIYY